MHDTEKGRVKRRRRKKRWKTKYERRERGVADLRCIRNPKSNERDKKTVAPQRVSAART